MGQANESLKVVLDVSSCSPCRATNLSDLLQVLHIFLAGSLVSREIHRASGGRDRQHRGNPDPDGVQDPHRLAGRGAGGDDVVENHDFAARALTA